MKLPLLLLLLLFEYHLIKYYLRFYFGLLKRVGESNLFLIPAKMTIVEEALFFREKPEEVGFL